MTIEFCWNKYSSVLFYKDEGMSGTSIERTCVQTCVEMSYRQKLIIKQATQVLMTNITDTFQKLNHKHKTTKCQIYHRYIIKLLYRLFLLE